MIPEEQQQLRTVADSETPTVTTNADDRRQTSHRLRIRVPQEHQSDPVISELVSRFGLTVNISAALLGQGGRGDGWFDLELRGSCTCINQALDYLNDLGIEGWSGDDDGW